MKTKTKKTKAMRRLALTVALLLILALLLAFDAMNGDPLSQQWAVHRAIQYAEKLYPDETFHWDQSSTGGQFFNYLVQVQSDQSEDTNFPVQTSFWLLTTDEGIQIEPTHTFYVDHRWNTAYRLGREASQQIAACLAAQAPQLKLSEAYRGGDPVEIDFAYTRESGMDTAAYADALPLDAPFDKAMLQKVPTRFCTQIIWEGKPTQADMQNTLRTLKQVLEANGLPVAYYDIALVPDLDYADHSAFYSDVVESGLIAADEIA